MGDILMSILFFFFFFLLNLGFVWELFLKMVFCSPEQNTQETYLTAKNCFERKTKCFLKASFGRFLLF